jgi:DNA-binding protein HU-beta
MTKFDLVQATSKKFKITLSQADDIVSYIYETIVKTIASGERVIIPGLGVFGVKERKAKKARNPRTGEEITIPAKKVVVFKPAKSLQIAVNKEG